MYFDLEDYRPDIPRVPRAISVREGVLISLLLHALMVIAWLVAPPLKSSDESSVAALAQAQQEPVTFVHIVPRLERPATPKPDVVLSDLDRRATSIERPAIPENTQPVSRGDTPEKVIGARDERTVGPDTPVVAPPNPTPPDPSTKPLQNAPALTPAPAPPAGGGLGRSLRDLTRYIQDQNFDNQRGGYDEQGPDIQFDSKGVDFGPWLRQFIARIKRHWYVPQTAVPIPGRVVIQFNVLRNGTIADLRIVKPTGFEPYNISALQALKLSSPTLPLPTQYPDDRAFFTVTFFYDVRDLAPRP